MTERLQAGDLAPEFSLSDDTGATVRLSDLRGRRVVLYFYPAAATPGCTTQAGISATIWLTSTAPE